MANYTLGRGKLYFGKFADPITQLVVDYRYIGNTPEFSLTIESETLDHFSSDEGIREKDDSVPLSVTRTGSFTADDIQVDNVALFFFGEAQVISQTSVASGTETFIGVKKGRSYQLGQSASNPVGLRGITQAGFAVATSPGGTELVAGTDYVMDFATGLLTIPLGSTIADNSTLAVTRAAAASTRDRVISGSTPVEGSLRYIARNPKGSDIDYIFPYVKITPNGDYALKGDEWQTIPFNFEALKPSNAALSAIYADGRPKFA